MAQSRDYTPQGALLGIVVWHSFKSHGGKLGQLPADAPDRPRSNSLQGFQAKLSQGFSRRGKSGFVASKSGTGPARQDSPEKSLETSVG